MLIKEELAREAAQRTWAATLVQARFRGKVGRWLARARVQVDLQAYEGLVHRREQMLHQHKVRVALRREAAASYVQSRYRSKRMREKLREQVKAVMRVQRFIRHLRTRRKWMNLLNEVTTYSIMVGRREAMLKRLQAAGKEVMLRYKPSPERVSAATRLQRFVKSRLVRRKWHSVIRDLGTYALMVGRREAVLRRLQAAGKAVTSQHRAISQKERRPTRVLTDEDAVAMLQQWWRRRLIQHQWQELIQDLKVNAGLKRKKRRNDAALMLQQWLRRWFMRRQWLRVVEEARARRQLRMLIKEELAREAAQRTWAAVLVQARFRGRMGRWLVKARVQVDVKAYDELLHRREQMLQQHKVRVAIRRERAATKIQLWWRRALRHRERLALMGGELPSYATSITLSALQRGGSSKPGMSGSFKRRGGAARASSSGMSVSSIVQPSVESTPHASSIERAASKLVRAASLGSILARDALMHRSATQVQALVRGAHSRRSSDSKSERSTSKSPASKSPGSHAVTPVSRARGLPERRQAHLSAGEWAKAHAESGGPRKVVSLSALEFRNAGVSFSEDAHALHVSTEAKRLTDELAAVKARRQAARLRAAQ